MMLLERAGDTFPIRSLVPCGFYHCGDARRTEKSLHMLCQIVLTARLRSSEDIGPWPGDHLP
ncbi:hypothetical protein MES4922_30445 [Mesorhizobium ventifaucium]|uniref:Uncharacterized protein n=1 Tax=Mesorhizobium ventifaucium TaxID=666020 RepID=A0ABN8JWI1_9HYPH|nr:hypothetical protein MES4922_30445 [Mesorhizobium ventifaucium]